MERTLRMFKKRLNLEISLICFRKLVKRKRGDKDKDKLNAMNTRIKNTEANFKKRGGHLNEEEIRYYVYLRSLFFDHEDEDYGKKKSQKILKSKKETY